MSMALKASGREILLAACNWGSHESWNWMRSIGAHTYRSTGDIFDNYQSFIRIFLSQMEHLCQSAPFCFNDLDMLTVGMYNQGNAAIGNRVQTGNTGCSSPLVSWMLSAHHRGGYPDNPHRPCGNFY